MVRPFVAVPFSAKLFFHACRAMAAIALAAAFAAPSYAQANWPNRPIKLVVPFAAGGNTDSVARLALPHLQKALPGASIVIENRGGAGGIVGTDLVAKAAPDGYTVCVCSIGAITISPWIEKLPYDPFKDLEPVSLLSANALVLAAHPSVEVQTVKDVIALAKAKPKALAYGSSGAGGLTHIAALLFQARTGTQLTHAAYRGGAPAMAALTSGEVKLIFGNISDVLPQLEAKKARALAVTTAERSPYLPDVPTMMEAGVPDYNVKLWNAWFVPKGTPKPVIDTLAKVAAEIAADPQVRKSMAVFGTEPQANSPAAFAAMLQKETKDWGELLTAAGVAKK
jgi:tripartite-type tricarboxylate transporter receptor subunit TctC